MPSLIIWLRLLGSLNPRLLIFDQLQYFLKPNQIISISCFSISSSCPVRNSFLPSQFIRTFSAEQDFMALSSLWRAIVCSEPNRSKINWPWSNTSTFFCSNMKWEWECLNSFAKEQNELKFQVQLKPESRGGKSDQVKYIKNLKSIFEIPEYLKVILFHLHHYIILIYLYVFYIDGM